MNKKLLIMFVVSFSLLFTLSNVQAVGDIDLVRTQQSPYPAEPGKNLNIEIEIQNNAYTPESNVVIELIPNDPFTLLSGEEAKKTFSRIAARTSVKASYNLKVSSSALSSVYKLEFHVYNSNSPNSYVTKTVDINLEGSAKFILSKVETIPINIEPGGTVDIIVDIENVGTGDVSSLEVSLDFESSDGTSILVPILAKGSVYLNELGAGETKQATFSMAVDTSAEYKTYVGTLTATYKDTAGNLQTNTFPLGIPVTGSIKLEIIKTEPLFERNLLRIQIANKGTTEAKSLEAKLFVNGKLIGVDYVSLLKENKQTSLDFPIVYNGEADLVLEYIGPNLEKIELTKKIALNYGNPTIFRVISNVIILIILLILFYFIAWKKFLKNHFGKKHHK